MAADSFSKREITAITAATAEVLVDELPGGLGVRLELVTDDAGPLCAVQQQHVRIDGLDVLAQAFECGAQGLPARVSLWTEQRMWFSGNDEAFDDGSGAHEIIPGKLRLCCAA